MVECNEPTHTISVPSRVEEIRGVLKTIETHFQTKGYGEVKYQRLMEALYEAMSNAVSHGNKEDAGKRVWITYYDAEDRFQIKMRDEGEGFDPSSVANPCSPENISKARGRGILIIKHFVDEVHFNEKGNEITLTIKK